MKFNNALRTAKQYSNYQTVDFYQLQHASQLLLLQEVTQLKAITYVLLELMATKLSPQEQQQLLNTELDPEPLAAIQRKIEEVQQQLVEDLNNDVYNSGL